MKAPMIDQSSSNHAMPLYSSTPTINMTKEDRNILTTIHGTQNLDSTLTVLAACLTKFPTMFLRVPLAAKILFLGKPGLVSGKLTSSSPPPLLLFYSSRLRLLTLWPTVPAMSLSEGYGAIHILNMEL